MDIFQKYIDKNKDLKAKKEKERKKDKGYLEEVYKNGRSLLQKKPKSQDKGKDFNEKGD